MSRHTGGQTYQNCIIGQKVIQNTENAAYIWSIELHAFGGKIYSIGLTIHLSWFFWYFWAITPKIGGKK